MAIKLNEERMITNNMTLYEERVHSPIRRFTDKTFTPVRYWHIKGNETTVDSGWGDVESIIGPNSPIRFQMIENLPLCGIEQIIPQVQQDTETGLDVTYEGEASTMDGTLRPFQNDFFMISYLKTPMIFRVTSVEYDAIASDAIYKISYSLEYIDSDKVEELMNQTVREYSFILENVGTEERCIIESSEMEVVNRVNDIYDKISETYLALYHNERYNCFLGNLPGGMRLYDPFQEVFIRKHKLFTKRNQIDGLVLMEQFSDPQREIKYQKSIYRYMELRKSSYLNNFKYVTFIGATNPQTAFYRWVDASIQIVDIPRNIEDLSTYTILSDEFVDAIRLNGPTATPQAELIKRFARNEVILPEDIDPEMHDAILDADAGNLEIFFLTPILLYIMKTVVENSMSKKKRTDEVDRFL